MQMIAYTPPLRESEIASYHEIAEGIDRTTILLNDEQGDEFSLTVETQVAYSARIAEDAILGIESDGEEPIFMVPDSVLTPDILDDILQIDPAVLSRFLVRQEAEIVDVPV